MAIVCTSGGIAGPADIRLNEACDVCLPSGELLKLYAVSEGSNHELYYLFCASSLEGGFLEERPHFLRELLLPLPMVPLRKSERGFHMLSRSDWEALLLEEETAAPIFSSAQRSLLSLPPEAEGSSAASDADSDSDATDVSEEETVFTSDKEDLADDVSEAELLEEPPVEV